MALHLQNCLCLLFQYKEIKIFNKYGLRITLRIGGILVQTPLGTRSVFWDPILLWGSRWHSGSIRKWAVINIRWIWILISGLLFALEHPNNLSWKIVKELSLLTSKTRKQQSLYYLSLSPRESDTYLRPSQHLWRSFLLQKGSSIDIWKSPK